jgi:glycosyltransferase involved in cell wall biosynthesis
MTTDVAPLKTCIIIPVYNHETALPEVLTQLKAFGLPCLLINDGSSMRCSQILADLESQESDWVTLITRPENGGKGAAVLDGFKTALSKGYTHAIQIDADGQHNAAAIAEFTAAAQLNPDALILGKPVFDETIPKHRLYGREITNFWIRINTLSEDIADGMCGFRLYPLAAMQRLLGSVQLGQRMDFDIDIVVRLFWQGLTIVNIPVKVNYPLDGVSHFRLWRDNLLISLTHARLFFGMLWRFPRLLLRHIQ